MVRKKAVALPLCPVSIRRNQRRGGEKWMVFHNLGPLCDAIAWVVISPDQNVTQHSVPAINNKQHCEQDPVVSWELNQAK